MTTRSRGTICPSFASNSRPLEIRGRRECRMRAAPEVSYAMREWMRVRAYRAAEAIRHSLRNGFTAYNVISPAGRARCHRRPSEALASSELDASLGRQDHTSLPYASAALVCRSFRVHRNPSHDRGDHDTPLWSGRDGIRCSRDFDSVKQKYFRFRGLTSIPKIRIDCPSGKSG
jgi:hypothetical protein